METDSMPPGFFESKDTAGSSSGLTRPPLSAPPPGSATGGTASGGQTLSKRHSRVVTPEPEGVQSSFSGQPPSAASAGSLPTDSGPRSKDSPVPDHDPHKSAAAKAAVSPQLSSVPLSGGNREVARTRGWTHAIGQQCRHFICTVCPPEWRNKQHRGGAYSGDSSMSRELHEIIVPRGSQGGGPAVTAALGGIQATHGAFEVVLGPHSKLNCSWVQFFPCWCLLSLAVDPIFFLVFTLQTDAMCISINYNLLMVLTTLRSVSDLVYWVHILIQFRLARVSPKSAELIRDMPSIKQQYLRCDFALDLLCALPVPQIWLYVLGPHLHIGSSPHFGKVLLMLCMLLQYMPRLIRFFHLLASTDLPGGHIFESSISHLVLNLALYFIFSQIMGCIWYLFAIQRLSKCLFGVCAAEHGRGCRDSFLICPHSSSPHGYPPGQLAWAAQSDARGDCAMLDTAKNPFQYGIYSTAVQLMSEKSIPNRVAYTFYWGFAQISTLGSSLVPSPFLGETLFTVVLILIGLMLVAMLISNVQRRIEALTRRSFDYQMQLDDVECWMKQRRLHPDLQRNIRNLEHLNWCVNKGVNEEEIISHLTKDLSCLVRRHLRMDLIKQLPLLCRMDAKVLYAISEKLTPRLVVRGTVVIARGDPINSMFFVHRGELECTAIDSRADIHNNILGKGDVFGEELLQAYSKKYAGERQVVNESGEVLLRSPVTITAFAAAEIFSLEKGDLDSVCQQFPGALQDVLKKSS